MSIWTRLSRILGSRPEAKVPSLPTGRDPWRGVAYLVDIPDALASLVRFKSSDQADRVDALSRRLSTLDNQERIELDLLARHWNPSWGSRPTWWSLTPEDLEHLSEVGPAGSHHFLGVASFHPSGRMREAALRKLGEGEAPDAFPYIILRLNDWADPVATLAQELLPRIAVHLPSSSILDNLDLIIKLQRSTRRDHTRWVEHFLEYLSRPEQAEILLKGLHAPSLPTRRICFDLVIKTGGLAGMALLDASRSEPDPIIRRKVQRAALGQVCSEDRNRIVAMALKDPVPSCRKAALEWLEETQAPEREAHCRAALLDRSRSVRETARWTLHQLGINGFRDSYLVAADSTIPAMQVIGIQGLGEVGQKEDAAFVETYARSSTPGLRNAAVLALAQLDAKTYTPVFLEAMASEHPGTSRLAANVLLRCGPWPTRAWLLDLYRSTPYAHVRRGIFSLVHKLPKWQGMAFFLDVMPQDPTDADSALVTNLDRWLRSILRVPPPIGAEREEARARLHSARARLGWSVLPEVDGQLT